MNIHVPPILMFISVSGIVQTLSPVPVNNPWSRKVPQISDKAPARNREKIKWLWQGTSSRNKHRSVMTWSYFHMFDHLSISHQSLRFSATHCIFNTIFMMALRQQQKPYVRIFLCFKNPFVWLLFDRATCNIAWPLVNCENCFDTCLQIRVFLQVLAIHRLMVSQFKIA